MAQTSIHIEPIKRTCEKHNLSAGYRDTLDYVHHELTHKNESEIYANVKETLADIRRRYKETTGQRMQKKATPIREGVLVIGEKTTMEQVKDFCRECQKRWGIKPLHISIHRDEGYPKATNRMNLHAHIVWNWTDEKGKAIRLNREDMSLMQDLASACLHLERGKSSTKQHLSALEYKNEQERQKSMELQQAIEQQHKEIAELKASKAIKGAAAATGNAIISLFRSDEKESMKNTIKQKEAEIEQLNANIDKLKKTIDICLPYYTKYNKIERQEREQDRDRELRQGLRGPRKNNGMEM